MPSKQLKSGILGFFETTVGRAVRRALVGSLALAGSYFIGKIVNDPTFYNAVPTDTVPFVLYWVARTLMDYRNPKISNLK